MISHSSGVRGGVRGGVISHNSKGRDSVSDGLISHSCRKRWSKWWCN